MLRACLIALSILCLTACGSSNEPSSPTQAQIAAPEARTEVAAPEPAAEPAPPVAPEMASGHIPGGWSRPRPAPAPAQAQQIGIPECDRFLNRYRTCLAYVPEEARDGMSSTLESWRTSWLTTAGNPAMREGLAATCARTAENTQALLAQLGCP